MSLAVILSLATTAFGWGLNHETVGCGNYNEKCCTKKHLPKEERSYYDYYEDDWCWDHYMHVCSEGTCVPYSSLSCGGQNEACCDPAKYPTGYMEACFDGLYCVNNKCQGLHALDCGVKGERCCTQEDTQGTEYYHMYSGSSSGFCFGYGATCKDDKCVTCHEEGDECCYDMHFDTNYCHGGTTCKDRRCTSCGGAGEMCCNENAEHYYTDHDCEYGLECYDGVCQHCGYENTACCGTGEDAYCRLLHL